MLSLHKINSHKELKAFIKFPMELYKSNPSYVPPLMDFELSTLDRRKNPAFEHSIAEYWIVKKENKIVGRVAGIILNEELKKESKARFGWIDFIDDYEVSELLLRTVSDWAKQQGALKLHGPMGFTDIDFEGALIEGFDEIATQATIYNAPYYKEHYEKFGLEKAVDWIERRGYVPENISDRLIRGAQLCKKRYNFRSVKFKKNKDIKKYAPDVFNLLNKAYSHLYGYYPLSAKQISYYTELYFGFIKKEFVNIVVNDNNEIVGMAICVPSISKGLKKAQGSLFPFRFIHVLRDFYSCETVDLFLIGVHPKYQKTGVHGLIFHDVLAELIKNKVKYVATGPMLEENNNVRNLWKEFAINTSDSLKRRCYIKAI